MPWTTTSPAEIEAAARAAIAAAFPLASLRAHDPRSVPPEKLPAASVTISRGEGGPASMAAGQVLASGELTVSLWVNAAETDRNALADLAQAIPGVVLTDPALGLLVGALDATGDEIETAIEGKRLARIDATFAAQWLETPAAPSSILARFGLA